MAIQSKLIKGEPLPDLVSRALQRMAEGQSLHCACGWTWDLADSDARLAFLEWIRAHAISLEGAPYSNDRKFLLFVDMEASSATE